MGRPCRVKTCLTQHRPRLRTPRYEPHLIIVAAASTINQTCLPDFPSFPTCAAQHFCPLSLARQEIDVREAGIARALDFEGQRLRAVWSKAKTITKIRHDKSAPVPDTLTHITSNTNLLTPTSLYDVFPVGHSPTRLFWSSEPHHPEHYPLPPPTADHLRGHRFRGHHDQLQGLIKSKEDSGT